MAGISGDGTTFNLPNYTGELFAKSPQDTPFLSAIGGLNGARRADAILFQWQGYDLRDADETRQRKEGQDAPTAEARVRFNVNNVVEIHQEALTISYSKLGATGQFASTGSTHTGAVGLAGSNPVADEVAFQVNAHLAQIARDVETSFINGTFNNPSTNATARRTRGILEAISTNSVDAADVALSEDMVLDLLQSAWENGGITQQDTATIMAAGAQTRALTKIFITDKNYREESRTVGGVSVRTILTDFGQLNVMLNRYVPADTVVVVSLEQCAARFLPIPDPENGGEKGLFFVEPLAKSGASEKWQLYGEVGLEYGNEAAHGKIENLSTGSASA